MSARVDDLMRDALGFFAARAYRDARRCFEELLALDPGNRQARRYLANIPLATPAAPAPATPDELWGPPPQGGPTELRAEEAGRLTALVALPGDQAPAAGVELSGASTDAAAPAAGAGDQDLLHLLQGARELLALNDFSGALQLFEKALARDAHQAEARAGVEHCRGQLLAMLEAKLGDLRAVPRVVLKLEDILWLNIDHRAGFVLARIDGLASFEEVVELSGMDRLATYRILHQLLEAGAIEIT